MEIDSEIENIAKYLAVIEAIDLSNPVHLHYLVRAIEYADQSIYTANPKSLKDINNNEIFQAKAVCYFRRKILNPFKDFKQIDAIRRDEHFLVSRLKAKQL